MRICQNGTYPFIHWFIDHDEREICYASIVFDFLLKSVQAIKWILCVRSISFCADEQRKHWDIIESNQIRALKDLQKKKLSLHYLCMLYWFAISSISFIHCRKTKCKCWIKRKRMRFKSCLGESISQKM